MDDEDLTPCERCGNEFEIWDLEDGVCPDCLTDEERDLGGEA